MRINKWITASLVLSLASIGISSYKVSAKPSLAINLSISAKSSVKFANDFYHATGLLYLKTREGYEMQCTMTAFEKTPDGYNFLTASHCVDGLKIVYFNDDESNETTTMYAGHVIAQSDRSTGVDAAVIHVKTAAKIPLIPLGHDPLQVGEPVLNVSGPSASTKQLFHGDISAIFYNRPDRKAQDDPWNGYVLFSVPGTGPGSSGSMIVCEEQQAACGILVGHVAGATVAVPISRIEKWYSAVKKGTVRPLPLTPEDLLQHVLKQ